MGRHQVNGAAAQRVLIVKIGAIGDVAMAMPMVTEIRRRDPRASITWLSGTIPQPLLALAPGIDEIIIVNEVALLRGSTAARLAALAGVWRRLAGRTFDLVCVGHSDRRYKLLAASCRARVRRSFADARALVPGRHHGLEYLRLVTGEDGPLANPEIVQPALQLPDSSHLFVRKPGVPLVVLAPGGASNVMRTDALRRWPVERYAVLAKNLLAQGMQVVLSGAQSDTCVRPAFAGLDVDDLLGRTSLPLLVSIMAGADLVVSHDSSAVHLAALVNTPLIGLFGPTRMDEKLWPRANAFGLWGGESLSCRPCYDGRDYCACTDNLCMQDISVAAVEALAGKAIAKGRAVNSTSA